VGGRFFIAVGSHDIRRYAKCYNYFEMETLSDTHPEITALQHRLLRRASPARKLAMLGQMNQTVNTLALSGFRSC
jgi:hypothetical protein